MAMTGTKFTIQDNGNGTFTVLMVISGTVGAGAYPATGQVQIGPIPAPNAATVETAFKGQSLPIGT